VEPQARDLRTEAAPSRALPTPPRPRDEQYVVALGSNLGDRRAHLEAAIAALAASVDVVAVSPAYETAPVGVADRPFLNAALVAHAALAPSAFLALLEGIERARGRVRARRWENRTLDLDLLLWRSRHDAPDAASRTLVTEALVVPHAALLDRAFALVPAADVAPRWIHPATGRTLAVEVAVRRYALADGAPLQAVSCLVTP
jgi:2-amino-4-hydroxy-6-hydroxymethyldihydropteridine diphosphokinase